jgi:ABC-type polysaccharide/polyol phosphate transport system ATPase subunit
VVLGMDVQYAIELKNITKIFRIRHEKKNSIYEYITSFFNKNNSYEDLTILRNVSLSVKKGEMLGILGLNGSGKTTLLKIITKIYAPNEGTVTTDGKIIPFLELGTGFNGELTARENIILYGIILGFTKKEIVEKIDEIIRFAELEKFLDTKLKNFSAGMNARLAFSTAMSVEPDILLVDEVLSVGDIKFQEKSFNAFMKFKKAGKTILFVSHSIDQIRENCDKALWLHDGVIRDYGDVSKVTEEYMQFAKKI